MIKLEDRVTSFELSKKLKKLGVLQESLWYWVNFNDGKGFQLRYKDGLHEFRHNNWEYYSAFTVAEGLEGLPKRIPDSPNGSRLKIWWDAGWYIVYEGGEKTDAFGFLCVIEGIKKLADAASEMRIFLIKKGLVKVAVHESTPD